jgi:hypothetical protein
MAIEVAGKRYLRTKLASPITTKDRGSVAMKAAPNSLGCMKRFTTQQIDLLCIALAAYHGLPFEQFKQNWLYEIGRRSPQKLREALVYAVRKGRLTVPEAAGIASILDVSLHNGRA